MRKTEHSTEIASAEGGGVAALGGVDKDRACLVYEETFTPKRKDARYCSNACRQDAYRKRKLVGA
jgi:hypothetical protein